MTSDLNRENVEWLADSVAIPAFHADHSQNRIASTLRALRDALDKAEAERDEARAEKAAVVEEAADSLDGWGEATCADMVRALASPSDLAALEAVKERVRKASYDMGYKAGVLAERAAIRGGE